MLDTDISTRRSTDTSASAGKRRPPARPATIPPARRHGCRGRRGGRRDGLAARFVAARTRSISLGGGTGRADRWDPRSDRHVRRERWAEHGCADQRRQLLHDARRSRDTGRADAGARRHCWFAPRTDRVQADVGLRRAGDRRRHRLPRPRLVSLQLNGVLDGRSATCNTDDRLDRTVAGRLPRRFERSLCAAEIGSSVPLHLVGETARGTVVPPDRPSFGIGTSARDLLLYDTLRNMHSGAHGPWFDSVSQAFIDQLDLAKTLAPVIPDDDLLPASELAARLEVSARLINANLGFRVMTAGIRDSTATLVNPTCIQLG